MYSMKARSPLRRRLVKFKLDKMVVQTWLLTVDIEVYGLAYCLENCDLPKQFEIISFDRRIFNIQRDCDIQSNDIILSERLQMLQGRPEKPYIQYVRKCLLVEYVLGSQISEAYIVIWLYLVQIRSGLLLEKSKVLNCVLVYFLVDQTIQF